MFLLEPFVYQARCNSFKQSRGWKCLEFKEKDLCSWRVWLVTWSKPWPDKNVDRSPYYAEPIKSHDEIKHRNPPRSGNAFKALISSYFFIL
ncbi:hypothetical protein B5X24_HaOG210171 [Helicoverpa armigera]|uniref:Uncharacterized protein n=1 Tax=Helicoverpa armigera TaxID=29058 RepID=A0A2W1BCP4_HELAM|nr:hypothetical protein B5X24_HaOG210171 [Helicoverpa armigera]